MSASISTATGAPSSLQSLLQPSLGPTSSSDPLDQLLQTLNGSNDPSAQTACADTDDANSGAPPSAFDPSTFATLLSAQEQSGNGAPPPDGGQGANQGVGHGAGHGAGHAGGDPFDSQSATNADGSTTETVSNPDGSTTTTVTYANGTTEVTTTPAPQGVAGTSSPDPSSDDALPDGLNQLQSLLAPVAGAALAALL